MAEQKCEPESQASPGATPEVGDAGTPHVPTRIPRYDTRTLFGSARELVIEHAGHEYRLRMTRQGKLILTK